MNEKARQCDRCGASLGRALGDLCAACLLEGVLGSAEGLAQPNDLESFAAAVTQRFGGYEVFEEIGRGGMGVVYRARQPGLGRIVALKMLLAGEFAGESARKRLLREARIAAGLHHPNIVTIHEVGEHEGLPFFAMEFVGGRNLAQLMRDGLLPVPSAARSVEQLARAVHYAHEQGVIHCDLKPANVLITLEGEPKLTDFGLTRLALDQTQTFESAGSPNFMAPEQAGSSRGKADRRTDVYGLGGILYYLLTGLPPALGESLAETLRSVVETEPAAPRMVRAAVPRDLETIALRCLEKDPAKRYATALEVAEELARWQRHEPILARPASAAERAEKWIRRRPLVAGLTGACALALLGGMIATGWQWRQARRATGAAEVNNYVAALTTANQQIEEGQLEVARGLLLQQPERLRGWEWGRLMAQSYPTLFSLTVYSNAIWTNVNQFVPAHALAEDASLLGAWGDGFTRIYSPQRGELLKSLGASNQWSGPLLFTRDAKFAVVAGPGDGLTVWETATWTLLRRLGSESPRGRHLLFSPGENTLAASKGDREIEVWDWKKGELLREMKFSTVPGAFQISSDGKRLWGSRAAGSQTIYNFETGKEVARVPADPAKYYWSAVHEDGGRYITIDKRGAAAVWRVGEEHPDFETAAEGEPHWMMQAVLSSKYPRLVVLRDGSMRFWDLKAKAPLSSPPGQVWQILQGSPELFVTTAHEGFARVWEWETGREMGRLLAGNKNVNAPGSVTQSGQFVSIASGVVSERQQIHVWGLAAGDRRLKRTEDIYRSAISPDGKWVAGGDLTGAVTIWDAESGELARVLRGHWRWVMDVAWMPDSRHLYSGSLDHTIRYWDTQTGASLATLTNHLRPVHKLAITPDGRLLASSDSRQGVLIWETKDNSLKQRCNSRSDFSTWSLELSPDGRWVAGGFQGVKGGVWDTGAGRKVFSLFSPGAPTERLCVSAAFSWDGKRMVVCDLGGQLRFYETGAWQLLQTVAGRGVATQMRFSADDSRLFLMRSDGPNSLIGSSSVEVHDGRTGRFLVSLGAQRGHAPSLTFSDASRRLAHSAESSYYADRTTQVWDALPWKESEWSGSSRQPPGERLAEFARVEGWRRVRRTAQSVLPPAAAKDREPRLNWPCRAADTPGGCIDLTDSYNAHLETGWEPVDLWDRGDNDLAELPRGAVTLAGVTWDIRGVISLGRREIQPYMLWPADGDVRKIKVGRKCSRLHFLHASSWSREESGPIGKYRLRYEDGTARELEIRAGIDIGDWWFKPEDKMPKECELAWTGKNIIASREGFDLRLYRRTWENPNPEKSLVAIDFISAGGRAVPFLVALSVE